MDKLKSNIHKTADVSKKCKIGKGTVVWNLAQIREGANIGRNCTIGKNVYIDTNVAIGDNVKIQNNSSIYQGVTLENCVLVGPHVCFTNDKYPRSTNPDGSVKKASDWIMEKTLVKEGASIGANSTILPGVTIGQYALIGAGSVITKDVPPHAFTYGNPNRVRGYVCYCARTRYKNNRIKTCPHCKNQIL